MRDLFARLVGVTECASPAPMRGYTGYTDDPSRCNRENFKEIKAVTPVTPVTPENGSQPHAPDDADRMDAYEERAAILEYDGRLSRSEAERQAWLEVFGNQGE